MADIVLRQLRLGYGLDDRGVGERFAVITNISVLHNVQTDSGAHPTFIFNEYQGLRPQR
jgi:hypothetical protein